MSTGLCRARLPNVSSEFASEWTARLRRVQSPKQEFSARKGQSVDFWAETYDENTNLWFPSRTSKVQYERKNILSVIRLFATSLEQGVEIECRGRATLKVAGAVKLCSSRWWQSASCEKSVRGSHDHKQYYC